MTFHTGIILTEEIVRNIKLTDNASRSLNLKTFYAGTIPTEENHENPLDNRKRLIRKQYSFIFDIIFWYNSH